MRRRIMSTLKRRCTVSALGIVMLSIFSYDLVLHFTDSPSLTSSLLRTTKDDGETPKAVDCCFHTFMHQLLNDHNVSGNIFFIEPDPPIPISRVPFPCRHFLIPRPVSASRLKRLVACYSPSSIFTDKERRRRVRRGLRIVKKIFDDNKVPLVLAHGSLIGSHRYHGLIPYDNDFDFVIPKDNVSFIENQLSLLCKKDSSFSCSHFGSEPQLQLLIGIQNPGKDDYTSYIDFFTYFSNNVYKWKSEYISIFPFTKRPFEGDIYDSVSNYPQFYKRVFGRGSLDMCQSFDHREKWRCWSTKCDELNSFLPFLVASETPAGRLEIVVNGSYIRSLFFYRK